MCLGWIARPRCWRSSKRIFQPRDRFVHQSRRPILPLIISTPQSHGGVLSHLPHSEQALAVRRIASALKKRGKFLFTSGDKGTRIDDGIERQPMNEVPFHYWSLTAEGSFPETDPRDSTIRKS